MTGVHASSMTSRFSPLTGCGPIVVAPDADIARSWVRTLNRRSNVAIGLCGADAALLPATPGRMGSVQTHILSTLTHAGYVPVIEPVGIGIGGEDVVVQADDVAGAIAAATDAARVVFFDDAGGVVDAQTEPSSRSSPRPRPWP